MGNSRWVPWSQSVLTRSLSQVISNHLAGHSEEYDCNDDLPIKKQ